MNRYFISDPHFGHYNIIKYSSRPFKDTREMNDYMITKWNETVKPNDHISCLGDVTMARGGRIQREEFITLIKGLNGHKRLYLGNHDHFSAKVYLDAGFEKIYATWRDEDHIIFSHFPLHPRSLGSAIANVHGHTHTIPDYEPVIYIDENKKKHIKPYINISVEQTEYKPISIDEIKERIRKARNE